ncbi:MAG: hypothetical protein JWN86_4499 [Planctomycetota bacterium]|nr:hypothetical protein [Planctomycetota bacterium]
MALYFLSDVHLRLDRPERARRLSRFVASLGESDQLVVVGDLCDFWFASRERRGWARRCEGLLSLSSFRSRGGVLTLLPGNHDGWLGPFFESVLGTGFAGDAIDLTVGGVRYRATHGHRLGARSPWKGAMESRTFLHSFAALPGPLANVLDGLLDSTNKITRDAIQTKHLAILRRRADRIADQTDCCVFGHIHVTHDDREGTPRMVLLGGWHDRSSYLRVDDHSAQLVVVEDGGDLGL